MLVQKKEMIERHIKTHSERSAEDCAAVATLEYFLQSEGRINTNFAKNDTWPNTDGTFEFVLEPESSRRPKQNFFVQIKGTHVYKETAGVIKYSLKSLAFPAFIYSDVTLDPGILFVVLDPDKKGKERVFWKYMSVDFISSINYEHESVTVCFSSDEELKNTYLTKTHTALQNLQRRIDNPGDSSDFISIDSFTRTVSLSDYDIIFVDECSTIDNRTMQRFLQKLAPNTFLVLAGDIYQIESIDFGNWFFYAKDIISTPGSNVELLSTWRTKDEDIISLWDEVRTKDALITEKLVIDGPFSEDIGPGIFRKVCEDEVILCLNYDGKFGLNNMNAYFQNANPHGEAVSWREWSYKVGDPILFNETKRFPQLYNNLKGHIVDIEKTEESISFTVDVDRLLTEMDCQRSNLDFIEITGPSTTRIRFTMFSYDEGTAEENEKENLRMMSVVPFQLAYAVSIHKAQGLEYDSVKVIIPNNNSERITHGIFYTAITRAKKSLKIYWSAETMKEIVSSFSSNQSESVSLDIVKSQLCCN